MFFQELKSLLNGCAALAVTLSSGREGAITVTVRPTPKDAKDAEALAIPLVLTGTAEELDAQFVDLLQSYAEEHQSLAEQLEATRNILEAAKKDASKKAEGAIRKSAPAKMTPAADDDEGERLVGRHGSHGRVDLVVVDAHQDAADGGDGRADPALLPMAFPFQTAGCNEYAGSHAK